MLERVGPFKPGQRVKASWLQEMLSALKALVNVRALYPLKAQLTPSGLVLSMQPTAATSSTGTLSLSSQVWAGTITANTLTLIGSVALTAGTYSLSGNLIWGGPIFLTYPPPTAFDSIVISLNAGLSPVWGLSFSGKTGAVEFVAGAYYELVGNIPIAVPLMVTTATTLVLSATLIVNASAPSTPGTLSLSADPINIWKVG